MLAEQVRRSLRAPINIAGQEIVLTASIGIALYDGPDEDPAELLREAEIAMYRAKRAGPDRIEIFNAGMRTEKDGRLALESDLRRAVEKRQLRLVYQPIFYLPTEQLAGFEALLRWDHPTLGTLNPTDFVPVAEESDLIVKLGSYVLANAVREAVRWQKELPRPDNPVFVGVNVSSRQLFRPELIKEVRHILGRAVIPKGSLRLEITESLVMENPEKATAVMRQLADAGAGLALDDFGTGYSSLSYLNQFTFDTIKIDRSFLHASGENGAGSVILRSVVALAARARQEGGDRGGRDRGRCQPAAAHRLRVRPGLLLRRADVGARGAAAPARGAPGREAHEPQGQPPAQAAEGGGGARRSCPAGCRCAAALGTAPVRSPAVRAARQRLDPGRRTLQRSPRKGAPPADRRRCPPRRRWGRVPVPTPPVSAACRRRRCVQVCRRRPMPTAPTARRRPHRPTAARRRSGPDRRPSRRWQGRRWRGRRRCRRSDRLRRRSPSSAPCRRPSPRVWPSSRPARAASSRRTRTAVPASATISWEMEGRVASRGRSPPAQAWPASLTRWEGSMPIFDSARSYF